MLGRSAAPCLFGATLLLVSACGSGPNEVGGSSATSTGGSSSGSTAAPGSSSDGRGSTSGTPATSSSSGAVLDSTGGSSGDSSSSTTTASTDSSTGSSEDSTGAEVSDIGCADDEREILVDELAYPNIAACNGGFGMPGVGADLPLCDRNGGDDGPLPDGMACSIDDLCAEGWHVCSDLNDVVASGMPNCDAIAWEGGFYATAQSGQGFDTCSETGTNDIFGCGEIGLSAIKNCTPLNRSTGNLCVNLGGPWSCDGPSSDEVSTLIKEGPTHGGALCCRDAVK